MPLRRNGLEVASCSPDYNFTSPSGPEKRGEVVDWITTIEGDSRS